MNTKMCKGVGAAVSLLLGMGIASPALATSTGVQALGAPANSIDVWTFRCPAGTVSARARVFDIAPDNDALMQVVLGQDSAPTVQMTDEDPALRGGEDGGPSPHAVVPDGPGFYAMAFKKTAGGAEGYIGQADCVLSNGINNPILTRRINQ